MSLFKSRDIEVNGVNDQNQLHPSAVTAEVRLHGGRGESKRYIRETIQDISPGTAIFFQTDGAWSNMQLLEYLLCITGPADIYFTTWSISADAVTTFKSWIDTGMITNLHAILDSGLRNRKPEIYQLATGSIKNLRLAHCHAKVTVISNATHHITISGSANYTRNPRKEAGVIIWDKAVTTDNIKWILEEFK